MLLKCQGICFCYGMWLEHVTNSGFGVSHWKWSLYPRATKQTTPSVHHCSANCTTARRLLHCTQCSGGLTYIGGMWPIPLTGFNLPPHANYRKSWLGRHLNGPAPDFFIGEISAQRLYPSQANGRQWAPSTPWKVETYSGGKGRRAHSNLSPPHPSLTASQPIT